MCISDLIQLVLQQNAKASIAFITAITFLISTPTTIQHLKGKNAFAHMKGCVSHVWSSSRDVTIWNRHRKKLEGRRKGAVPIETSAENKKL